MRVSILIASEDKAYTAHISGYISEFYADIMEVSVCNSAAQLQKALSEKQYNVALMDESISQEAGHQNVDLPMLLWTERVKSGMPSPSGYINKHQRISVTVASILERLAEVSSGEHIPGKTNGNVTAVWSPCGGVGKTSVALAYAASKVMEEKKAFYLNLEHFAATPAYFDAQGKSISEVFEMLDSKDGNVQMLIQGIRGCDNGIDYLCAPDNYDDICILSRDNISELIFCCAGIANELVIDMSCACDERTRQIFEMADKILLVADTSDTARIKISQFISQSNVYETIKEKILLVVNKKHAKTEQECDSSVYIDNMKAAVCLPYVQSADEKYVYKTLACASFG